VPRWVEQLAQRYNAFGPEALGDQRRRNGRPATVLTDEMLSALAERVQAPPEEGGVWTGPKVAAWVRRPAPDATGWRGIWACRPCIRSAAGKPCSGSAGRSRRRGHGMCGRRHPSSKPTAKGAGNGGRAGQSGTSRPAGRGLGGGRTPPRPEADPPPGLGAHRPAADRSRPPPLPMASVTGHRLSTLLSTDPVAELLLLSGVGAGPPPDGVQ
jgi:hypothetical protein